MSGPTVAALHVAGPGEPWRAIGFDVNAADVCRIGAVDLRLGRPGRGLVGWTLTGEGAGDVDGIPTEWVARVGDQPDGAAPTHPNTALSVDHVVVRSADAGVTFSSLSATGMVLRGERVAGGPDGRVRQGFFRHGEAIVEVVGPEHPPRGEGPPPEHDASTLWGLTVTVADIDACAALLEERLGAIRAAVQPGRRIATVRREVGLGVRLAVMSP